MAEDKTIRIKVEFIGDSTQADSASNQAVQGIEKVQDAAKKSNDEFGLMNTKVGKVFTEMKSGAEKGIKAMSSLKGAVIATGIGALLVAVMGIVEWFKKTETGADLLAKGSKILGQVVKEGPIAVFNALKIVVLALLIPMRTAISTFKNMKDVLSGKQSLKEALENIKADVKSFGEEIADTAGEFKQMGKNIADASRLADAWDKLEDARRDNKVRDKQLDADIADLRERAADADETLANRANFLAQAQAKLSEQHQLLKDDKEQEIKLIEEELRLYPDNQEWIEKLATAKGELADIERKYSQDKKSLGKAATAIEKQITAEQKKEIDERKKLEQDQFDTAQKEREDYYKAIAKQQEEWSKYLKEQKDKFDKETLENEKIMLQAILDLNEEAKLNNTISDEEYYANKRYVEEEQARASIENKYALEAKLALIDATYKTDAKKRDQDAFEAKKQIQLATIDVVASFGNFLTTIAGKNKGLAKAGLIIEKAAAIATVITQTMIANAKSVAAFPITAGMPWVAINTAAGAVSIATIIAQAAKGIKDIDAAKVDDKKALGGWLGGPSHQDGGVSVVGEGGEFIVNKRTMADPSMATAIQSMNSAGNTGYSGSGMLTEGRVVELIAQSLGGLKVYVTERDITDAQKKVEVREAAFIQ